MGLLANDAAAIWYYEAFAVRLSLWSSWVASVLVWAGCLLDFTDLICICICFRSLEHFSIAGLIGILLQKFGAYL